MNIYKVEASRKARRMQQQTENKNTVLKYYKIAF